MSILRAAVQLKWRNSILDHDVFCDTEIANIYHDEIVHNEDGDIGKVSGFF